LGSIIFLAIFASSAIQLTQSQVEKKLDKANNSNPLLAVSSASLYIVISLACVAALSFVLVLISFIIPMISAYIVIPFILLLMLLLGSGFIYRYFGNKLPFVGEDLQ
jgi:Flp pilus assembly protein TadB